MPPYNPLQQLHSFDKASPQFPEQLLEFLCGDAYRDALPGLRSETLTSLVEYLDSVLIGISDYAIPLFQESLRELRKICGTKDVLPKSWTLSEPLLGCVYKGSFNGSKVRIRRVRMYSGGDPHKVKEAFRKVAVISKRSAHPNIVPLLGVTLEPLELISEWMSGGDLPRYISKHPGADILSLLSDVAEGLSYLHSCNVIHGDLKGSNILVDQYDRARITDFGLSMVTQDLGSMRSIWIEDNQSVRWIAPEILGGGTYSKETDIFSLAGVTIEAFTGAAPFSDKPPHEALSAVERGERPPRPAHPTLTNEIWKLIEQCWDGEASLRPHALIVSCGFKGVPVWKRLTDLTLTMDERISLIMYYNNTEVSRRLPQDDAQSLVDEIDKLLNTLAPQHRRGCLGALRTICGQQALLPKSLQIQLPEDWPIEPHCNGGYADVWKVEYRGSMVAVKILKVSQTSDLGKIKRNFFKEVILWKTLHHPNVLPLLGAIMNERRFGMVSKWMVNESIGEFVKNHKNENRFELLKGVTIGLMYLHKQEVIHGDLKGANILIDQNRVARLADFGLLTFARDPANPTTSTTSIRGTARWMSPELLYPERFGFKDSWPTEESDRYALGMVILEVLSGQVPFVDDWDIVVIRKVTDGERPKRPDVAWLTNNVWGMLSHCWAPRPPDRPMLQDVLRCLAEASLSWATLSHPISSTLDTYEGELPDQEETLSMDEPAIHGANFGPEHTYTPVQLDETLTQFSDQRSGDLVRRELSVEDLDKALDDLSPAGFGFKRALEQLQGVSVSQNLLPSSHLLLDSALRIDRHPFSTSEAFGAYTGKYNDLQVCVKKLRVTHDTNLEQAKKGDMLFREALMWKRLKHPNIVPFIGATIDPPQIASQWMPGGNLTTYIKSNPQKGPISLLVDVAKGLDYLHSHGVIHGDLKGSNILVDLSDHARITDFGLAQDTSRLISMPERQSARWTAPEVLAETGTPSTEADVFSFAMVMVEAFTGMAPFSDRIPQAAIAAIISGKRPPRPTHSGLTHQVWELMNRCWDQRQHHRPRMLEALLVLNPLTQERTRPGGPPPVTPLVPNLVPYIQQRLQHLKPSNEEYRPLLYALLSHKELRSHIDSLRKDDIQGFVELLDEALNHVPVTDDLFRKALRMLQSACSYHEVLPQSCFILGRTLSNRGVPSAAGGSAGLHEGRFDGKKVWIRALRPNVQCKISYGGAVVWKRLQHPNIVSLIGIPAEISPFEMVCDWMGHGSITEYVGQHPEVDRIGLLWDVAEGLHHLHLYNIVHGDLKGANVLIDKDGHARLTDFGLASVVTGNQSDVSLLDGGRLTTAPTWAAPEILKGGTVTKGGDVFAFGMVAIETFTGGSLPRKFYDAVSTGERPERPATLRDDLWNLMQICWSQDPGKRPTSFDLVDYFRPSFLGEQATSETQTISSALSDETLSPLEGRSTGSHSDLSAAGLQVGRGRLRGVLASFKPRLSGSGGRTLSMTKSPIPKSTTPKSVTPKSLTPKSPAPSLG